MNRNRIIFYLVFASFHLAAFIFTVMLANDTGLLFGMVSYVPMFKWLTLLGLLLLVADVTWFYLSDRASIKEKQKLIQELNILKAKLFDIQESTKKQDSSKGSN
jgi:hypothetical protein